MRASFEHEKTIFHLLILFIVASDRSCLAAKASNVTLLGQLNVEQQGIEVLRTPRHPSKSAPI